VPARNAWIVRRVGRAAGLRPHHAVGRDQVLRPGVELLSRELDQRLRALLPPKLAAECRLANCRGGQLVFLARTPDWASKLRLSSRQLLHEARVVLGVDELRLTVKVARPDANSPFA